MRIFGLIGHPLSHSFSKKFFNEKFLKDGETGCSYENFPIADIKDFSTLIATTPFEGINVTIPYKQLILPYLDEIDDVVSATGACNCIKFKEGKLFGYNTDTFGFEQSLQKHLQPHHDSAIVLGTGGAAKAIIYVLEKLNIKYVSVSRLKAGRENASLYYESMEDSLISSHHLIINTTPVGTYPDIDHAPLINYDMITSSHYLYDLVYNPDMTLFLKKGKEQGAIIQNGLDMLILQAEESWRIWNHDH